MGNKTKQQARGWRQWREDEARAELAAFLRSGMTTAGYSRSRGISARRLEYWKKRLTPGASDIAFVPVALPAARSATIDVVIGDILISLAGRSVTRMEDIQSHLAGDAIGKTLPLKFIRGGAINEGIILVAERPHGSE